MLLLKVSGKSLPLVGNGDPQHQLQVQRYRHAQKYNCLLFRLYFLSCGSFPYPFVVPNRRSMKNSDGVNLTEGVSKKREKRIKWVLKVISEN